MREIKFRGKRLDNGEWVCGFLVDDGSILNALAIQTGDCWCCISSFRQILPETVGQYTGLRDKNDREIYENSNIGYRSLGSYFTGKVVWCEANLTYMVEAVDGDGLHQRNFLAHINDPELLKEN